MKIFSINSFLETEHLRCASQFRDWFWGHEPSFRISGLLRAIAHDGDVEWTTQCLGVVVGRLTINQHADFSGFKKDFKKDVEGEDAETAPKVVYDSGSNLTLFSAGMDIKRINTGFEAYAPMFMKLVSAMDTRLERAHINATIIEGVVTMDSSIQVKRFADDFALESKSPLWDNEIMNTQLSSLKTRSTGLRHTIEAVEKKSSVKTVGDLVQLPYAALIDDMGIKYVRVRDLAAGLTNMLGVVWCPYGVEPGGTPNRDMKEYIARKERRQHE